MADNSAPELPDEMIANDQRTVVRRLFAERKQINMSLCDLEAGSGLSSRSFYAWRGGMRDPSFGNLVAFANMLGFEFVMRRRRQ